MRSTLLRKALLLAFLLICLIPAVAAHVSGRGFILLLPTNLFIAGGALVVAASFALMALIPLKRVVSVADWKKVLVIRSGHIGLWVSVASLLVSVFLILAGWYGSRDPLRNPAPMFIWSVWWPGMTIVTALLGNVWAIANPWTGVYNMFASRGKVCPILKYPERLGYFPAIAIFFGFAWVELVHPSPADPTFLSNLIAGYLIYNFVGIVLFGEHQWLKHCEAFSVFFRMVSWISSVSIAGTDRLTGVADGETAGQRSSGIVISLPTAHLVRGQVLRLDHTLFIILSLSTVSFDGFSRTFAWLSLIGVNPLEYPGRTALMLVNTLGLLATFGAITAAYVLASWLSRILVFQDKKTWMVMGMFIPSIVPIALGYHIAHYFPYVVADIRTVYAALSDPFGRGWNLFNVSDVPSVPSFLKDPYQLYYVYYIQVGLIVLVHILAVYIAHVIALREVKTIRHAMLSQAPLTLLMVGYTMFGLWLLSSPSVD
ncbi:MAG: hypothetical protein QXD32_05355 [Nitrososphaerota archaeon]